MVKGLSSLFGFNNTSAARPGVVAAAGKEQIEVYSGQFFAACAFGGVISCGMTHAIVVPLDLVKCRMQVNPGLYRGLFHGFREIAGKEGVLALSAGWMPTLIGYGLQGANKFGFYEFFKYKGALAVGRETYEKYKTPVFLVSSACAELIADTFLAPWEAIKVRVQTKPEFGGTSMFAVAGKMLREEGSGTFFKGLVPLWLRQIPYTMVKFASFEKVVVAIYSQLPKEKHEYGKDVQLAVTFAAGYIAGVFCAIVSHPADTVVSKLNNTPGATIGSILSDLGFTRVWNGLGIRILMIGTLTGLQWLFYDSVKQTLGLPTSGGKSPFDYQK